MNRRKNVDYLLFLSFKTFFQLFNKIEYLTKHPILVFLLFRKIKKKNVLKCYILKTFFLFNYSFFFIKYKKLILTFKINIFIDLNFLIFNKKYLQAPGSTLINNTLSFIKRNVLWSIKKEYLELKFNKINFLILFDTLKNFIKSKKTWLNIFSYYQINKHCLSNQLIFKKTLFISLYLNLRLLDHFIFYLFKRVNKKIKSKFFFDAYSYFSKKQSFLYVRCHNSFFLNIFVKKFYINQLTKELLCFLENQIKTKKFCFSISKLTKKGFYFLGFQLTLIIKSYRVILRANLVKIFARFFFLGYMNKLNKPIAPFLEYFAFNQVISLIKFKFILQSLHSYYSLVKNKKYMILKIILMLKISISKVFTSKFKYKSRAQIFKFFKKNLSRFILKKM